MIYDLQAVEAQLDDLELAEDESLEDDLGDAKPACPKLFLS